MKLKKNILIVSPTKIGLTETFIRAHIDQLYGNVFYLYGWNLDFKTQADVSLKELYKPKSSFLTKFKSLLPHYIYFRLLQKQKKNYTKEALIKRYIKEHHIDVVMAEYGTAGSFITPICKNLDIPLLVHFHGFDASRKDTLNTFKKGYELMFSYATKIIVASNAMKQALVGQGCPETKLLINTYGPHPDYLNIEPDLESNYIISVGRHTYKKAPYLTILAFQKVLDKHPSLEFKMIGDGELFDVSKNLVKSLGLENNIILLGGLERKEIIKHLQSAFLFVQHSLVASNGDSEGTPVGIIEAMAAGLPVVSTRHAGIPDVVIENKTGLLVDENNIEEMASYMLKLVENRNLAESMGQKGKAMIQDHFTMEKHLETINNLIYAIG
ncbi:glycosyltransferase [Flavobacteriaceae bacterium]|nr:glycosyltransferase [Flavobacteriaceae bacterium]